MKRPLSALLTISYGDKQFPETLYAGVNLEHLHIIEDDVALVKALGIEVEHLLLTILDKEYDEDTGS